MVKPNLSLVFATSALVQSWSLSSAATNPATEADSRSPGAHLSLTPSARVRRAAAAGVPPQERKLSLQSVVPASCYLLGQGGPPSPVSCNGFSCTGSNCVADEATANRDGSNLCVGDWAYKVSNPNTAGCVWQYACC
jgi:hypothetical protein